MNETDSNKKSNIESAKENQEKNTVGQKKIPVVVIFAPTASGKTALTKDLFSESGSHFIFKSEIISADSQAVYKYMDIGTAKPTQDFCKLIPHHLIDLVEPSQQFTVADFVNTADSLCESIYSRGAIPVICGGTGFYIRSFLFGLPKTPESNERIREELQNRLKMEGNANLYAQLQIIDPESAAKININDAYRICRALEVYFTTGKKRSEYKLEQKLRSKYDFCFIVLEPPKDILFDRINKRVDLMFEEGLPNEVKKLQAMGYTKDTPGMKAIGYSEWFESESEDEIKENIKKHSCKYAKKQYTYIRDIPESIIIPFDGNEENIVAVENEIRQFYKKQNIRLK
ncbi:MAG: tRNA (adenosine(37)-N6)-dimethylallyltransferase MiaA [Treponema sp.]|nr:tRNA (adenosine(37)-N6)-dimethylallyltransferase MiaA [Treponema sp.]